MRYQLNNNLFCKEGVLGLLFGLHFSSHALRTSLHIDYHQLLLLLLLGTILTLNLYQFDKLQKEKIPVFYVLSYSSMLMYISIQAIMSGSYYKGAELISILLLLLCPWLIKRVDIFIRCIVYTCTASVLLQSFLLIFNKSHIYSFGLNYLLIASLTPVVLCYLYYRAWSVDNKFFRVLLLSITVFILIALLQVQGRYSLLIALVGILLITIYRFRKIMTSAEGIFILVIISYTVFDILSYLESSPAIKRTIQLVASGETLDRIVILKIYLNELKNVWFMGFGLGKTPSFPPYFYPHNFLLEFATEFGMLGVIFIAPLTFLIVKTLFALSLSEREHLFVICLSINYLFFFLKSGSIYDSYTLFAVFSVVLVMSKQNRESHHEKI